MTLYKNTMHARLIPMTVKDRARLPAAGFLVMRRFAIMLPALNSFGNRPYTQCFFITAL